MTFSRFIIPLVCLRNQARVRHDLQHRSQASEDDVNDASVEPKDRPLHNDGVALDDADAGADGVNHLEDMSGLLDGDDDRSTAIARTRYTPLVAGLVIPFSILLEIPGLTERWYIKTDANRIVDIRSNPPILDAGMALSMASAVAASACLLARFMERRVKVMTMLCVMFLTIHGAS
jgi:hypothetical protein